MVKMYGIRGPRHKGFKMEKRRRSMEKDKCFLCSKEGFTQGHAVGNQKGNAIYFKGKEFDGNEIIE
jgi:hypothetical protein